ncbi:acyltransferase, partial [Planosporangium mesophilum]
VSGITVAATSVVAAAVLVLAGTEPVPVARPVGAPHIVGAAVSTTQTAGPPPVTRPGRAPGAQPRIAIFGDSVAYTLGEFLLPVQSGLAVTSRGKWGCGITRRPAWFMDAPHGVIADCEQWDQRWRKDVDTDDPDVAVILLDRWELMARELNGRYQHLGDPDYDAYITGELRLAIATASVRGARVVLLTAPYLRPPERPDGSQYPEDTPERVDAWNRLLAREAAANPVHPTVLDLNRVICPGGAFAWSVGGVRVRSDGVHLTPEGVQQIIAPWLLPRLAAVAMT